jgi:hypothetical protein
MSRRASTRQDNETSSSEIISLTLSGRDIELSADFKHEENKRKKSLVNRVDNEVKRLAKMTRSLVDRKISGAQKQTGTTSSEEHSGCNTRDATPDAGAEAHSPADCERGEALQNSCSLITKSMLESVDPPSKAEKHRLSDCETVPASEEMSYVHDFADCPVDKAVLDYVDAQNKEANDHDIQDCTRASSVAPEVTLYEHVLARCPSGNKGVSPGMESNQHRRATYASSTKPSKDQGPKEHRLVSCPVPPIEDHAASTIIYKDTQHRLSTCVPEPQDVRQSSGDSEANERTAVKKNQGKDSTDENNPVFSSPRIADNTTSGGESADDESQDRDVIKPRKHQRRRHNRSQKPKQLDGNSTSPGTPIVEHTPVFATLQDSAQVTLERVLAAQKQIQKEVAT